MRIRLSNSIFAVLLLALLSSSSLGQQPSATPANLASPKPLTVLPRSVLDAELTTVEGRAFRLSDYSGKVLVVNLWATWLSPSRLETPALVKLHKQFRAYGVQFVGLSTENPKMSAAVRKWIRKYGVTYRVGWAPPEATTTLIQGRNSFPQTFVISRSGKIIKRFVGFNLKITPLMVKEAIEEALNENADVPAKP